MPKRAFALFLTTAATGVFMGVVLLSAGATVLGPTMIVASIIGPTAGFLIAKREGDRLRSEAPKSPERSRTAPFAPIQQEAELPPSRTLRGSDFHLSCRVVMAAIVYATAIWGFTVVAELWDTDKNGALVSASLCVAEIVLATRYVLCSVVISRNELRARGVFRNWNVQRSDVVGIETKPFNGSVLARLRLTNGSSVGLPLSVQGGPKPMADVVACLEAWRRGPVTERQT